jgi:hypothetical protein
VIRLPSASTAYLEFAGKKRGYLSDCFVEAEYGNCDGVTTSTAFHADENGRPYEIAMWKVDFIPLREYTATKRVTIKT